MLYLSWLEMKANSRESKISSASPLNGNSAVNTASRKF